MMERRKFDRRVAAKIGGKLGPLLPFLSSDENTIRRRVAVFGISANVDSESYLSSNGRASLLWWSRGGDGGGSVSNIVRRIIRLRFFDFEKFEDSD